MKPGVAGHFRGGIGWHPLTAWCSHTGDHLVVMQRPGNAGSFTATDHVQVLDAALAQIPAAHRGDLPVTIGWPLDERTRAGLEQLPEQARTVRLAPDGRPNRTSSSPT